jgi:aminocarboxymuconate-semialdehyde decarboxylase
MSRSDHGCQTPGAVRAGRAKLKPTEVKRMYYDSLVFTPEALRHLVAEVGASHVVMGTDYPYPWSDAPVDHVLATPALSDADREAISAERACAPRVECQSLDKRSQKFAALMKRL